MRKVKMEVRDEGYEWLEDGAKGRELGLDFSSEVSEVSVEVRGQGPTISRLLNEAGFQAGEAIYIISVCENRTDAWESLHQAIGIAGGKGLHITGPDSTPYCGSWTVGTSTGCAHRAQRLQDALAEFVRVEGGE